MLPGEIDKSRATVKMAAWLPNNKKHTKVK